MNAKYRVDVIESERGWGQRLDFQRDFDTYEEAEKYQKKFNAENNKPTVPDWYMVAIKPYPVDLDIARPPKK